MIDGCHVMHTKDLFGANVAEHRYFFLRSGAKRLGDKEATCNLKHLFNYRCRTQESAEDRSSPNQGGDLVLAESAQLFV